MGPTSRSQNDSQGPETNGDDRERTRSGRGGTQLYDAIYLASDELMKPKDGRKALVVFSDGVDAGQQRYAERRGGRRGSSQCERVHHLLQG